MQGNCPWCCRERCAVHAVGRLAQLPDVAIHAKLNDVSRLGRESQLCVGNIIAIGAEIRGTSIDPQQEIGKPVPRRPRQCGLINDIEAHPPWLVVVKSMRLVIETSDGNFGYPSSRVHADHGDTPSRAAALCFSEDGRHRFPVGVHRGEKRCCRSKTLACGHPK